jgi:hypothetical protein
VNLEYGLSPSFYAQLPTDLKETLNHWLRALAQAGGLNYLDGLAGARAAEAFRGKTIWSLFRLDLSRATTVAE